RDIGSSLAGITSQQTMTGAFTTGSFSYTPDQLRDLVTEWKRLADTYAESIDSAAPLEKVDGPGKEYASESLASVASSSGGAYVRSLKEKQKYCLEQAQQMPDTLDDYLGRKHHNLA